MSELLAFAGEFIDEYLLTYTKPLSSLKCLEKCISTKVNFLLNFLNNGFGRGWPISDIY